MFYDYDPGKHKFYHFSEVNLLGRFICTRCVTAEHLPFIYTVVCIEFRRMYTIHIHTRTEPPDVEYCK